MKSGNVRIASVLLALILIFSAFTAFADDGSSTGEATDTDRGDVTNNGLIDWSQFTYDDLLEIQKNLNDHIREVERQYAIENGNRIISLNESDVTIYQNKTITLHADVKRVVEDAPETTTFVWKSSDEAVASVDKKGVVKGVGYGDAVITCTASDDEYVFTEAKVHVVLPVTAVILDTNSMNLLISDENPSPKGELSYSITPENAFEKNVNWVSSDEGVATVDEQGTIHAVAPGKAIVSAVPIDPESKAKPATCTINVLQAVSSISLNEEKINININGTANLKASVLPDNASNKSVTWESSDPTIATVTNNGQIKAVAPGTAIIKCTASDGSNVSSECSVDCIQMVTGVKIDASAKTISVNKDSTVSLKTIITPNNASVKDLTWSSSNSGVATVDKSGKVSAVSGGAATITCAATDGSGKTASIEVFVPSISVTQKSYSVRQKTGYEIKLKYYGKASDFSFSPTSNNFCDIRSTKSGDTITLTVNPKKAGTVTLTLKDKSNSRSDTKVMITIEHSACYDKISYPVGNYSSVLRYPSSYKGDKMSIYGRVLQISNGLFSNKLRVATKGRWDNVFYVDCPSSQLQGVIEGDYITIYGTCTGTETYKTILGASITIPSLDAEKVFIGKN